MNGTAMQDYLNRAGFEAHNLYCHDDGQVMCGRHVGIEATYHPQQWAEIGSAPVAKIDGMELTCEQCDWSADRKAASK